MRLLQECCGERHKHYVVNSESLAGVCVRHNDDCNAVCVPNNVPNNEDDAKINRVCTKAILTQTTLPLTRYLEGLQQDRQSAQGECNEG